MIEILAKNWWLVAIAEIAFVPLAAILCISLCVFTRKVRLARFDFELKLDMLQRGMSAEDIRTVIEAGRLKQDMLQRGMSAEEIRTVIEAGQPAVQVVTAPPRPIDHELQASVVPDTVVEEIRTVIEPGRPTLPVATAPPRPDHAYQARITPEPVVEEVPLHIGSSAT